MSKFKNAAPSRLSTLLLGNLTRAFSQWNWISRKIIVLSQSLDFVKWVRHSYDTKLPMSVNRESIWLETIRELSTNDNSEELLVLEFGVAWGYATNFYLSRFAPQMKIDWYAFDRFTGLPRQWRDHEAGAFDANGATPNIDDSRINFEVGNVEETLNPEIHLQPYSSHRKLILFDLDLFEPSLFAWKLLETNLRSGDILYFDEAFDDDERQLLNNYINKSAHVKFELLGFSHLALCLRVR